MAIRVEPSTSSSAPLTLRPGTPSDAQVCGDICYRAFKTISDKHQFPPDFPNPEFAIGLMQMILPRPDVYSVVAERDGRIIGSNFLWKSALIAGVGPITVDPQSQDGSVGRRLMDDVLCHAQQSRCAGVRLVQAGYHCRSLSLYTKLGFVVREPLACMQGAAIGMQVPGRHVRQATSHDLAACNQLARTLQGYDRGLELQESIARAQAMVVEHNGAISGYSTGIGFFCHAIGRSNDDLIALIAAAPVISGPGFLLPMRNAEVFQWCLAHGLRMNQPMNLMSMGLYNKPAGAFLPSILY